MEKSVQKSNFLLIASLLFCTSFLKSDYAQANLVGTDAQNFNPTSSGVDFVTVQSARTLDPGVLNFGSFLNYAANTLSFMDRGNPSSVQNRTRLNDKLLSADLSMGLGLTKNLDFGVTFPFLLNQEISKDSKVTYFSQNGNTEQRINAKYKFFENEAWANAFVLTANRNNIQDNPYTGRNPGLTYALEYASSWRWSDSWMAVNLGHRWRNPGESLASTFGFEPMPNMFIYGASWSRVLASTETKLILEIFGGFPSSTDNDINLSNRDKSSTEALVGIKHGWSENISLHAGAGTEIFEGLGSPDWRMYVGLNWTMGPLWKKSIADESRRMRVDNPNPKAQRFILSNLRFKFDSDILEQDSLSDVQDVISVIASTSQVASILVEGHTDSMGDEEYNLRLSQRRAEAIRKMITSKIQIEEKSVEAIGYGETLPIADNSNYQGRATNRRVVVTVYSKSPDSRGELIEIRLTE